MVDVVVRIVRTGIAERTVHVAIRVGLVGVGNAGAVVGRVDDRIVVVIGVADIADAIQVKVGLVEVGVGGAVVEVGAEAVAIRVVEGSIGAEVADIARRVAIHILLASVHQHGAVVDGVEDAIVVVVRVAGVAAVACRVGVELVGVGDQRAVVAQLEDAVAVGVGLRDADRANGIAVAAEAVGVGRAVLAVGAGATGRAAAVNIGLGQVLRPVAAASGNAEAGDAGIGRAVGRIEAGLTGRVAEVALVDPLIAVVVSAVADLVLEREHPTGEGEVGTVAVEDPGPLREVGGGCRAGRADVAVADDAKTRGQALGRHADVGVPDGVAEQRRDAGELRVGAGQRDGLVERLNRHVGAELGNAGGRVAVIVETDVVRDELHRVRRTRAWDTVLEDVCEAEALLDPAPHIGRQVGGIELRGTERHRAVGRIGRACEFIGKPEAVVGVGRQACAYARVRNRETGIGLRERLGSLTLCGWLVGVAGAGCKQRQGAATAKKANRKG